MRTSCQAPTQGKGIPLLTLSYLAAQSCRRLRWRLTTDSSKISDGNSQHPNYNVALGEQLIHDVYYAPRSGPAWNETLLIITYDEHGGCYDHVTPPSGAVPPDNSAGEYSFDFTRFGPRVPTVLLSPLIPAGTVFRVPDGTMPLDHTSILKTVETRWNLSALTARDAAACDVRPGSRQEGHSFLRCGWGISPRRRKKRLSHARQRIGTKKKLKRRSK